MRLGRERPRKAESHGLIDALIDASMRLGRERPRKRGTRWTPERPERRFNEAGARTPQKARRPRVAGPASPSGFNEAGARTPQKGRDPNAGLGAAAVLQ